MLRPHHDHYLKQDAKKLACTLYIIAHTSQRSVNSLYILIHFLLFAKSDNTHLLSPNMREQNFNADRHFNSVHTSDEFLANADRMKTRGDLLNVPQHHAKNELVAGGLKKRLVDGIFTLYGIRNNLSLKKLTKIR